MEKATAAMFLIGTGASEEHIIVMADLRAAAAARALAVFAHSRHRYGIVDVGLKQSRAVRLRARKNDAAGKNNVTMAAGDSQHCMRRLRDYLIALASSRRAAFLLLSDEKNVSTPVGFDDPC